MKKIYTSTLGLALIGSAAIAQTGVFPMRTAAAVEPTHAHHTAPTADGNRAIIWQNDFSNPSDWVIAHDPSGFALDWQIGTGLVSGGQYGTPAIASTTAANGYAMLCSDCGENTAGTLYEKSYMTTATAIDLSASPNVVLSFQTMYRRFTNEQTYVVISTDGVTWPQLPSDTATVGLPAGIYPVWYDGELTTSIAVPNPTTRRINISGVAGGQSTVWVRFYWYGVYGYAWYVDDVNIYDQYQYDVELLSGYMSHTGSGAEYARIPSSQLLSSFDIGGQYINNGVNSLTNVTVNGDVMNSANTSVFSATSDPVAMNSGDVLFADVPTAIPTLVPDVYTGTFVVNSAESANDGDVANDTVVRKMEVTTDMYSLDGIGVHPDASLQLSSLGTNTFTDNSDDIIFFTMYEVSADLPVYGIQVEISTTSVPGALVQVSIHDTVNILQFDPNIPNVGSPLVISAEHELTQAEVDAGEINIAFDQPYTLTAGAYMAGIQLGSNNNATDIRVLDDVTIEQPSISSVVYLPGGAPPTGTFTNGNAFAIRLSSNASIGINEKHQELSGISVYPNPSTGRISLSATTAENHTVEVLNALGQQMVTGRFNANGTMDLSDLAKGVYSVRVSTNKASTVQRIVLN